MFIIIIVNYEHSMSIIIIVNLSFSHHLLLALLYKFLSDRWIKERELAAGCGRAGKYSE